MSKLPADCINDIMEYLGSFTLNSCILVNRLWCNIAIRIFWRNVNNYRVSNFITLIACLPNESKNFLYEKGIIIPTPTSNPPIFNYATFCKIFSVKQVRREIGMLLKKKKITSSHNLKDDTNIIVHELLKMFMKQVTSLKSLSSDMNLTFYPETRNNLKNLSELYCNSDISPEFINQLSQVCQNIVVLEINCVNNISNELIDFISVQKNLKQFGIAQCEEFDNNRVNFLTSKLPNTLIKLSLYQENHISLSFITKFTNLQKLELLLKRPEDFMDFEKLLNASFPKLRVLSVDMKYIYISPNLELIGKFIEINGKNLDEIYIIGLGKILNLAISKFCPNLRKLVTGFGENEFETMEMIFINCQYLETIKIWCGFGLSYEGALLEAAVRHSQNINEIVIYYPLIRRNWSMRLYPEHLETFFTKWLKFKPQKSFSLVVVRDRRCRTCFINEDGNREIIEKHIKLGVVKIFQDKKSDDDFKLWTRTEFFF